MRVCMRWTSRQPPRTQEATPKGADTRTELPNCQTGSADWLHGHAAHGSGFTPP